MGGNNVKPVSNITSVGPLTNIQMKPTGVVKSVNTLCHSEVENIGKCTDFTNIVYFKGFTEGISFSDKKHFKLSQKIVDEYSKLNNTTFIWDGDIFDPSGFTNIIAKIMKNSESTNKFIAIIPQPRNTSEFHSNQTDTIQSSQSLNEVARKYNVITENIVDNLKTLLENKNKELEPINTELQTYQKELTEKKEIFDKESHKKCQGIKDPERKSVCLLERSNSTDGRAITELNNKIKNLKDQKFDPLNNQITKINSDLIKVNNIYKFIDDQNIINKYGRDSNVKKFIDNWNYITKPMEIYNNISFITIQPDRLHPNYKIPIEKILRYIENANIQEPPKEIKVTIVYIGGNDNSFESINHQLPFDAEIIYYNFSSGSGETTQRSPMFKDKQSYSKGVLNFKNKIPSQEKNVEFSLRRKRSSMGVRKGSRKGSRTGSRKSPRKSAKKQPRKSCRRKASKCRN